jgi:hypothetical protein
MNIEATPHVEPIDKSVIESIELEDGQSDRDLEVKGKDT